MDPYLEGPEWADFHLTFLVMLREELNRQVSPRYLVRIDRRVYLEPVDDEDAPRKTVVLPDVLIDKESSAPLPAPAGTATLAQPLQGLLPELVDVHEAYLEIREFATKEVVTALELLSPSNKRAGSEGREHYLAKRNEVLSSPTHLVEFDFLRGGRRVPLRTPLPAGDYFMILSRAPLRPQVEIYAWGLRDRLPIIPIPLAEGDPDLRLDLQAVFDAAYESGGYEALLRSYRDRPLNPPVSSPDETWIADQLQSAVRRQSRAAIRSFPLRSESELFNLYHPALPPLFQGK
jgi:hypothetical protein